MTAFAICMVVALGIVLTCYGIARMKNYEQFYFGAFCFWLGLALFGVGAIASLWFMT